MPKPSYKTPLKAMLESQGFSMQRTTEITGLSIHSIRKGCYERNPTGWKALAVEVDRLHRISKQVILAENDLLRAKLAQAEELLGTKF